MRFRHRDCVSADISELHKMQQAALEAAMQSEPIKKYPIKTRTIHEREYPSSRIGGYDPYHPRWDNDGIFISVEGDEVTLRKSSHSDDAKTYNKKQLARVFEFLDEIKK